MNAAYVTSQSILFNGERDGVLYRQSIMRKPPNNGVGYIIDLAEITVPGGVIRIDRCRLAFEHELTLGHFGLPHFGEKATLLTFEDEMKRGITASIPGRSVTMIAYNGWDTIQSQVHRGFNAETEESTVLFVHRKRTAKNPAMELMITAMLHKTDDTSWTPEELDPVKGIRITEVTSSCSILGAEITLADNTTHLVDFKNIDGLKNC
jgi:hypothetical protein